MYMEIIGYAWKIFQKDLTAVESDLESSWEKFYFILHPLCYWFIRSLTWDGQPKLLYSKDDPEPLILWSDGVLGMYHHA